jgi:hypothetical protein
MEMQKSCEVSYSKYGLIRIPCFWRHAGRATGYITLPWSRVLRYITFCCPRIPQWLNAISIGLPVISYVRSQKKLYAAFAGRAAWKVVYDNKNFGCRQYKSQVNKLTPRSRIPLEKVTIAQLVNKLRFLWNRKVLYFVHRSAPLFPMLNTLQF